MFEVRPGAEKNRDIAAFLNGMERERVSPALPAVSGIGGTHSALAISRSAERIS